MPEKVTFRAIATRAGVGTATVERVLNGRGGVRPETVEKVIAAARRLDYPKRLPKIHRGVLRVEVLMARPELSFMARLSRAFERIAATLDTAVMVHRTFVDEDKPLATAQRILNPTIRRSALIVALPQHPAVCDALNRVKADGLPIVQVMTRMEGLVTDFVGIDNEAAGRMAGLLMCGMQGAAGTVIALCHSQIYGVHRDRLRGFSDYMMRQSGGRLNFKQISFMRDDARELAKVVDEALRAHDDLAGLYLAGGDYGALIDLLRRSARHGPPCIIGHELTELTAGALKAGLMTAVIDQAPETQARRALDLALHRLGLLKQGVDLSPIRFITITPENL
jgi:LacI family transcriptional regulator